MEKPKLPPLPPKPPNGGTTPPWRFPFWYFALMLLLLWMWQTLFNTVSIRTLPYSEFKDRLAAGEIRKVDIKPDEILGQIIPKSTPTNSVASPGTNVVATNIIAGPAGSVTSAAPARASTLARGPDTNAVGAVVSATGVAPTNTTAQRMGSLLLEGLLGKAARTSGTNSEAYLFRTVRVEDPKLIEELKAAGVEFAGVKPSMLTQFLLSWVLPIAVMMALWIYLGRKLTGTAGSGLLSIGKSKAKLIAENATGVTFEDVAGCDEAKFELQEVVDFLKNPDRYKSLGARIPKGALLIGPPGTGKTLLGRAVAGEAKVPFFSLSGSDFVEMFVGVGAARVRDLFQQAKAQAPCIVFIDELDAIGRQRGVHVGSVNDEREQTLNQLLVEMDGFEANAGVIVLAATNRPEILDRALLRPGRFDRQVLVDSPDAPGRESILRVHARNKPLSAGVDLRRIAQATPGFSGADLANTMNEAALLAARRNSDRINQVDLENAIEKVVAGPERKGRRLGADEKRRVAYHEVGHALVAVHSKESDPVHKISIVPRGRAALGYTMQLPIEDQFLLTRSALLGRIRGLLGGRAAEEIIFAEVTTGAENDLERATATARQMVAMFGMSERIGLLHCAQRQNAFLAGPEGSPAIDCSEETARDIDREVKQLLERAYAEAKDLLNQHREQLETVTAELLKTETLDAATFYRLIGQSVPELPTLPAAAVPTAPAATNAPPVSLTPGTPPPLPMPSPAAAPPAPSAPAQPPS